MVKKVNKGQSVLEFLITLPIILLVCLAAISIGMYIYCKLLVVTATTQAAKQGAYLYQMSINPELDADSIYTQSRNKAMYFLESGISISNPSDVRMTLDVEDAMADYIDGSHLVGKYVVVGLTYQFKFIFPLTDVLFDGDKTIPIHYEAEALYLIN